MAYVSVSDWRPEQVTEWLKGLDSCLLPYLHWFSNNQVNGQQLLNICPDELTHLGVVKIGHQELILEGVDYLRNFHYELDRENLQALALRVASAARSLHSEVRHQTDDMTVPTQTMSDVANVVSQVMALVSWLDRSPFAGQLEYVEMRPQLLSLSLKMATSAQRGRFAESPIVTIRDCSERLGKLADSVIQGGKDPMILQPAYLDLATLKKRAGEDLGFFLVPSYHGEHQVGDMKLSSPAHQSGKIQAGDEVVQVNYQTVVGWARKKVIALFEESPNDLLLTLKRRPRHVKMYGQMYMKPYRLPSRKRAAPYSRWNENLPSPRPDFLTIPRFEIPRKVIETASAGLEDSVTSMTSSSSDEEFPPPHSTSPTSMRIYLPKPRPPIQRRFTLSGPPNPSLQHDEFWRELQLERSWRSNQNNSHTDGQKDGSGRSERGGETSRRPMREKSASAGDTTVELRTDKPAAIDAKTIIELNKVKRDAFFSNMGCPPKPTPAPPRGRLDKSRSTPAYDLGEPEPKEDRFRGEVGLPPSKEDRVRGEGGLPPAKEDRVRGEGGLPPAKEDRVRGEGGLPPAKEDRIRGGRPPPVPSPRAYPPTCDKENAKGFAFEAPRQYIPVEGLFSAPPYDTSDAREPNNPLDRFSFSSERQLEPEHGQMVNTINQTLRRDRDEYSFFTDLPPAPREIRPIPAQRKLTLPPAPLPPKPKPRPLPPEPPPRPDSTTSTLPSSCPSSPPPTPTLSVNTEREKTKNTLDALKAIWSLGRSSSPRAARKHNAILARRRHVSVSELLPGDVSGVLWHRRRRGQAGWTQGFFLLTGPAFYGFRNRERARADLFIFLPGFTCSLAEEVKSKTYAFKIYHTGTVFYFAAESEEELQQWLDGASLATASSEDGRLGEGRGWSETDSDSSDTEPQPDTCFPTFPTRSKFLGAPSRSHQNLASDSAKCESPRKFSSLKKVSSGRRESSEGAGPEAASLDRKCLRFLTQKTAPVPVPTSQFRSYRRMQPPTAPPRPAVAPPLGGLDPPRLARRTLHSSNPSLINPDMADYRMTQERLREFRNLRSQGRQVDLSGFMTLEQFMLSRQEEERSLRSHRQTRTRVYPRTGHEGGPRTPDQGPGDKPQVSPRSAVPPAKVKLQPSSPYQPSPSTSTSDDGSIDQRRSKQLSPKTAVAAVLPDYPGIEYPPAFEPETYTLQYMLKNRRKRDNAHK